MAYVVLPLWTKQCGQVIVVVVSDSLEYRTVYTFSMMSAEVSLSSSLSPTLQDLVCVSRQTGSTAQSVPTLHCTECANMHPIKVDAVWRKRWVWSGVWVDPYLATI